MCLDRHLLAHSSAAVPHQPLASSGATPKAQTESNIEWTVEKIIVWLTIHQGEIKDDHVKLTGYTLQSTKASEKRIRHGPDLFANIGTPRLMGKSSNTMRIKFKQHLKGGRDKEEGHYAPICTKTNVDRVPPYRFHPVEIKKNVLAPNTMLTFAPHLRDLKSSEETQYDMWLKELEDMDRRSGFKPTNLEKKKQLVLQGEREATLALYLDSWLQRMAIPGCGKSQLIRYSNVLALESDETLSPQQKGKLLDFLNAAPGVKKAVKMFTDAFEHVFKYGQPPAKQAELRRVVKLMDETADNITGSNPAINGAIIPRVDDEDEDELAESNLSTYCILGCLICFSHSCDHGEYDDKNTRHTFSMGSFSQALRRRRSPVHNDSGATPHIKPYRRQCYWRDGDRTHVKSHPRLWSEDERIVLRSLYTTANDSTYQGDPICLAAEFLNRDCDEVHIEFKSMGISLPQPKLSEAPMKNLPWYDRRRKVLLGDWQDHTTSHAHQRREYLELCYHEGPCMPGSCACVDAGVLCEKFCGCTVDNCAYKFTGCGCLSQGKTCLDNKKDKPCICVQLNRECDPLLCGTCGALERADPLNANDTELHATGCQNCGLQRGAGKPVLLGQSQLDGVGYGLYTAEDVAQGEFIIEYVGELITHDEGVRREARRGDVFDEFSSMSYVFTLLENEGIWVDAAKYGNLSRYINHASEHGTRGCNITPRILYVNGEYRIKFTATRDIKAGEELFFNYGENFPNLTKNLLDHKASGKPGRKTKPTKSRRPENSEAAGRKPTKAGSNSSNNNNNNKRRRGRPRVNRVLPPGFVLETLDQAPTQRNCKWRLQDDSGSEYDVLIPGNGMGGDGGGRSLEEMEPPLRLRRQVRTSTETPTRQVELPNNTRSKRGGARPGSGRPRKHQRPASKPPTPPEHAPEAEPEAEPEADLETAPAPAPAPDPESTPASKNSDKMETEIADSDDNKPCNRARQGDLKMEGDGTVMDMYRYGSGAIERRGQDGHRPSSETTILDCGIEQGFDCGMVLPKENKEKMKENNHVVDICD